MKKLKGIKTLLLIGLSVFVMSCNKQYNDPIPTQQELITQEFSLKTILTTDNIPMSKGFDPTLWVYKYSDVKYELKISNSMNTYTKLVSVNEMLTGTISLQMVSGVYNITYQPVHSPKFDTKLDVSINMTGVQVNSTPIVLQGNLDDALIILDIPLLTFVYDPYPSKVFTYDSRGFWYSYTNQSFSNLFLSGIKPEGNTFSIDPLTLGKVYWVQSQIGVNVQLNIPVMSVQTVILP
jgi:hypothetical protein